MQALNAFKNHLTGEMKTSNLNAYIVVITERMTSQLKVLDVVVNKQPTTDYIVCLGNGSYLGTATNISRKFKKTTLSTAQAVDYDG